MDITIALQDSIADIKLDEVERIILPLAYDLAGYAFIVAVERTVSRIDVGPKSIELGTTGGKIIRSSVLKGETEQHLDFVTQEIQWAERRQRASGGTVLSIRPS